MISKIKQALSSFRDEHARKKAVKQQAKIEKEAEILRKEQEQIEKAQKELETEKAELLQMSDKELMVELIFAVRGFYAKFQELKLSQKVVEDTLEDVEIRLSELETDVSDLQEKVNFANENSSI